MSAVRITLACFAGLAIAYGVDPGPWRDVAFLGLGWWMAWAAFAAPRLPELLRRIGQLIEDMA